MPAGNDANKYGRVCQNYTVIIQENGARMREVARRLQVGVPDAPILSTNHLRKYHSVYRINNQ